MRWFVAFAVLLAGLLPSVATAAPCPASTVENQSAVGSALTYLRTQQRSDGGFVGFTPGSSDDFTTLRVAIALAAAGCAATDMSASGSGATPLTYLANRTSAYVKDSQNRTFPGRAGQLAVAAAALGGNPRSFGGLDLIVEIEATYNSTTGVYSSEAISPTGSGSASTLNQLWPIAALAAMGQPVPSKATDYLLSQQESGGGWGFGFGADVDTTAQVLWALAASRSTSLSDARIAQGVQYLRTQQFASGAWGYCFNGQCTDSPDSTGAVLQGLAAIGVFPSTVRNGGKNGYDGLLALQASDGSFGGNALGTADAIPGLTTYTFPVVRYRLRVPASPRASSL